TGRSLEQSSKRTWLHETLSGKIVPCPLGEVEHEGWIACCTPAEGVEHRAVGSKSNVETAVIPEDVLDDDATRFIDLENIGTEHNSWDRRSEEHTSELQSR